MKLSIITPCRNSGKTIERTIKSVLLNSDQLDIEYIIVDGASTDGTLDIIKNYQIKYPGIIKYISEKDNSMTEALNKGLKLVNGDIVASINADDEYIKGALPEIVKVFENNKVNVLMANTFYVIEETGRVHSLGMPRWFNEKMCAFVECPFPECGIFFKKVCFDKVGYFNEQIKYTQDFELYLRLLNAGYKFYYANINASIFYRSSTNYSSTVTDKMNAEVFSYFKYKKLYRIFAQSTASKILKKISGLRKYYFKEKYISDIKQDIK